MTGLRASHGQGAVLAVGALCAVLVCAAGLAAVARGIDLRSEAQRAADLAAVAGARAMLDLQPRLFDSGPGGMPKADYLAAGREAALRVARLNGAREVRIRSPDAQAIAPVRFRVRVVEPSRLGRGRRAARTRLAASAEAELAPEPGTAAAVHISGGGYGGPLAHRQASPCDPTWLAPSTASQPPRGATGLRS